jgi:DNA-binding MarR family transcriptional regulator
MSTRNADYPALNAGAALGARLRRLSDRIDREAAAIYRAQGVAFEQRWFGVLNQLIRFGPASGAELAVRLGVTPAAVSQVAAALTARGLVTVQTGKKDRRLRLLAATADGEALAATLAPLWNALSAAAAALDAEAGGVVAALNRLEAALGRASLAERVADLR